MMARRITVLFTVLAVLVAPSLARAVVVEKVVAIIGERAILLSDLRKRAEPLLVQIYQAVPSGPERAAAESKLYREVIERMVDEELESVAAERANVTVSSEDVDKALRNIARMANMTVAQLFEDIRSTGGMTEQEYRQEIRRQVLEGKLLHRQLERGARITEEEIQATFEQVRGQERMIRQYRAAWILLHVGDSPSPEHLAERTALAQEIVRRARAGESFAKLVRDYSDDSERKGNGGDLGVKAPAASQAARSGRRDVLAPKLERLAMQLEPGEVADPVRLQDGIVVLKLTNRQPSRYNDIETARPELAQLVQARRLEQIKVKWLKDLRRRAHVEVRL